MYDETAAEILTLEDVSMFVKKGKILFTGFSLIVAVLCYTLVQKLEDIGSRKQLALIVLIIFTPCVITVKAMIKIYCENLSSIQDTLLESMIEILGAASLVSFWVLFVELNQALAEPLHIDIRLLCGAYQYVGIRISLSVFMVVLQLLGTYSFWLRVLVIIILFVSEAVALGCISRLGVLVATRQYIIMFLFYKSFKYATWLQEAIVLLLCYFHYIDPSSGITNLLYGAIVLEMIFVAFLQHNYYKFRG